MDGSKAGVTRLDETMSTEEILRALVLHDRASGRQSVLLRATATLCVTCALTGLVGLAIGVWQSARRPVEAYVVTSDALGRFPEVRPLGGQWSPPKAMVADRLRQWIVNVRRRPSDLVVLRQQWIDVMAVTVGQASRDLQGYTETTKVLMPENTDRVVAEFTSAQQMSDGSWLVRWRETVWRNEQQIGPADWSALIQVTTKAPRTGPELAANPLGIWVTGFQWSPDGVTP